MNSHHAKRTLKESMGYKVFAVFMAFTLCLPTTLTSDLTNMRQAQAATEAAQEYASADGGDSAATDTDSSSDAAQGSSSENSTDSADPTDAGTSSGPADGTNATVAENDLTATNPLHNPDGTQQNNVATAQDESRKQALEKIEWTNQFNALNLTSKGLVVDPVALKDSLQQAPGQSKATEAPSQENVECDQRAVQLPASVPASLDLSFALDAPNGTVWMLVSMNPRQRTMLWFQATGSPRRCPRALLFRMKPPSSTCSRTMMGAMPLR